MTAVLMSMILLCCDLENERLYMSESGAKRNHIPVIHTQQTNLSWRVWC